MRSKFIILVIVTSMVGSCFCLKRSKRVINGVPLRDIPNYGRPTSYTAVRYYGALSSAHAKPWARKIFHLFGVAGHVFCSGTIITPKVFHTACHCVASFDGNVQTEIKPPVIANHWEGRALLYLGVSKVWGENSMENWSPIFTEKFIVHEKCGQLGNVFSVTYDYAVVQLPFSWIRSDISRPYPFTEIEFAPQYTVKQILDFYRYALQEQLVCLHVGFGRYVRNQELRSEILRTGWAVIMSPVNCLQRTIFFGEVDLDPSSYNTKLDQANWVCANNFSHHDQEIGNGDSGSPISCNNRYFGVASGVDFFEDDFGNPYDIISKYHPILHDLLVTAVDYREDLLHTIDDLKVNYRDVIDEYFRTSQSP